MIVQALFLNVSPSAVAFYPHEQINDQFSYTEKEKTWSSLMYLQGVFMQVTGTGTQRLAGLTGKYD